MIDLTMARRTITAGYFTNGERYRLEIEAEVRRHESTLTDHATGWAYALSITGASYRTTGSRDMDSGGQNVADLRTLLADPTARLIQDRALLTRLLDHWERWHLNDLTPGCDHQPDGWTCTRKLDGLNRPPVMCDTRNGWAIIRERYGEHPYPKRGDECRRCGRDRWDEPSDRCPETGYRFGSSWLTRALPESVIRDVRALFTTGAEEGQG